MLVSDAGVVVPVTRLTSVVPTVGDADQGKVIAMLGLSEHAVRGDVVVVGGAVAGRADLDSGAGDDVGRDRARRRPQAALVGVGGDEQRGRAGQLGAADAEL